ncbi:MAG TPA: response regulator, partial [Chthoniobacteraceae bacterium]
ISARRAAEAERHGIERKLQEAQKLESLGVLAGGIAHDFNNLLTGVLGNASLAATELPAGSPIKPYLDQIETASMRAAELCKQMLAYSGKGRFVVQRLDLNSVISETTNLLQISISKNAVLKLTLRPNLPPVIADVTQIRQIVMNLVINASEALADRSGLISVSTGVVRVDAGYLEATHLSPDLPEGDYIFLEVADNGMGMPPEVQARIFDPFFTTKFTGRGLGLAAVLGIVRGHKGALKVYSEAGRGTTFKVLFPCADGLAEELQSGQAAAPEWRGQGTVLIVDDEETVRATTARMFEVLGFKPLLASSGVAALQLFAEQHEPIILTIVDLTMPHMEGDQVFREIRRLQPDAKVLLMSGFNEQDAVSRFLGKGLAGFIQKPFRVSTLREKLQQIIEG